MRTFVVDWALKFFLLFALGLRLLTPSPAKVVCRRRNADRAT